MKNEEVIIIGGGPAGIAAAIQLQRFGITPLVFESGHFGGLLNNANLVENYPGFPEGIPGPGLVELFLEQFRRFGIPTVEAQVDAVDFSGDRFIVRSAEGEYPAKRVVAASGTRPRTFDDGVCSGEVKIHYEVYPLLGLEGAQVVIVGAGDAAFDYALNLADKNRVTILNRGSEIRALGLLYERASNHPRITYSPGCEIRKISGEGSSMVVVGQGPEGKFEIEADQVIGAIGRQPAVGFIGDSVWAQAEALASAGRWHLVGDVHNGLFRQTAIAVGEGVRAAMAINNSMEAN